MMKKIKVRALPGARASARKHLSPAGDAAPRRIGVLADDLTGAGDVSLGFLGRGYSVEIALADGSAPPPSPGTRVWILDTESRYLPADAARRRVRSAMKTLTAWRPDFIYKKIDSTLRGPVSAELEAFLSVLPAGSTDRLAFVPAFPRMGRTTAGGRQFVNGMPLERTSFSRDPRTPVAASSFSLLLGAPLLARFWTPDVQTEEDLRRAGEFLRQGNGVFAKAAVGSGGLAEALSVLWAGEKTVSPVLPVGKGAGVSDGILVVAGSAHPRTREQTRILKAKWGEKRAVASSSGEDPKIGPSVRAWNISGSASGVGSGEGPLILLEAPLGRGDPLKILEALTAEADRQAHRWNIRKCVALGGETAHALSRLWGVRRWRPVAAVSPGVALCAPIAATPKSFWMIMKPGGFGDPDILIKSVETLRRVDGLR